MTEPVTSGATATEIKRATYDTYAMIEVFVINGKKPLTILYMPMTYLQTITVCPLPETTKSVMIGTIP